MIGAPHILHHTSPDSQVDHVSTKACRHTLYGLSYTIVTGLSCSGCSECVLIGRVVCESSMHVCRVIAHGALCYSCHCHYVLWVIDTSYPSRHPFPLFFLPLTPTIIDHSLSVFLSLTHTPHTHTLHMHAQSGLS